MELKESLTIATNRIAKDFTFVSQFLTIKDGNITVDKGFKDNGCTCAKDTPKTFVGCCVHNALNEARPKPLSNKICDLILLDELKKSGFKGAYLYYLGARLFGNFFKS